MSSALREDAVQRLEAGLREQDRLGDRYDAAIGTSSEIGAPLGRRRGLPRAQRGTVRGARRGPRSSVRTGLGRLKIMTSRTRNRTTTAPARRRDELHRADGDRRVGQIVKARRDLATNGVGGRVWLNGREFGGADPRYARLDASHD